MQASRQRKDQGHEKAPSPPRFANTTAEGASTIFSAGPRSSDKIARQQTGGRGNHWFPELHSLHFLEILSTCLSLLSTAFSVYGLQVQKVSILKLIFYT